METDPSGRPGFTPEQWRAARALAEGCCGPLSLIAAAMGCGAGAVAARAAREGWRLADGSADAPAADGEGEDNRGAGAAALGPGRAGRGCAGAVSPGRPDPGMDGSGVDGLGRDGSGLAGPRLEGLDRREEPDLAGMDLAGLVLEGLDLAGLDLAGLDLEGLDLEGLRLEGLGAADIAGAGPEEGRDGAAADDPVAILARTSQFLARQLLRMMASAERPDGGLDKGQLDGLTALARVTERFETLATERAKHEEPESDDELAELLDKINTRILERAEAEAARLVAEGHRPG